MSEAQALENGEQPEGQEAPQEKKEEFNGFIDFKSDPWREAPEEVVKQTQARLAKESHQQSEAKRKLEEAAKRQKELEDQILELKKPKSQDLPDIDLAVTDPEEYQRQQQAYIDSQNAVNSWEQEKQERDKRLQEEADRAHLERLQGFISRSEKAGLTYNEINAAAEVLKGALPEGVGDYLIDHQFGGQLLVELRKNPVEAQMLANLNPIEAGVKLDAMAQKYKASTTSNAPPPDDPIKGAPTTTQGFGPEGATFE